MSTSGLPRQWQQWPDLTEYDSATPSVLQASSSFTSLWSPPSSSMAVKHGPCLLALEKGPRLLKPSAWGNFSASPAQSKINLLVGNQKKPTKTTTTKNFHVGPQESLLATVKRQKLAWFMHVIHHDSLLKAILRGTVEGGQRCGQQGNCWMDNIKKWTSLPVSELLTRASCRRDWKRIPGESSLTPPLLSRWPNRPKDRTELKCYLTLSWCSRSSVTVSAAQCGISDERLS